jgi:hypothetical protein
MDKKQRDIELARQVGFNTEHPATNEYLHQYAEKVRAEEREACAEICKKHADVYAGLEQNSTTQSAWAACIDNRDAIRARGQA